MSSLERKVDLLVSLALADTEESRDTIKRQLAQVVIAVNDGGSFTVEDEVAYVLQDVGVSCSCTGYQYLMSSICSMVANPKLENEPKLSIYYRLAEMYPVRPSQIERAMRIAVEKAIDRSDYDTVIKYFGNTISPNKGKPTNSEFVIQLAHHVRRRLRM